MEVNVRVSETDLLGHVNHANYFTYMEEARIEFLKGLGIEVASGNFTIILVSATCDFIRQGYFNQTLKIKTTVNKVGRSSFVLGSDIYETQSEQLIARGEVTVVYFDVDKQKSAPLPESFKKKLTEHVVAE